MDLVDSCVLGFQVCASFGAVFELPDLTRLFALLPFWAFHVPFQQVIFLARGLCLAISGFPSDAHYLSDLDG